ncbi:hypothetical protein NLJ89_g1147 [Agrocybe chaxingu]|uniref:Transmembrane protein n=1 Tax=Agrocybe chaxingu TaxID=84603 RepID=A0A9W8TFP5_9AGAR|nr:hypothetical protein NLJ89_g1147 [Agrocybe chaxingu]
MSPSILVDDADPARFSTVGFQWSTTTNSDSFFNRTVTVCHTEYRNTSTVPKLGFNFYGSDLHFYGPPVTNDIFVNYTIDRSSVRPANLNKNANSALKVPRHTGVNIWNLTGLDQQYHRVDIFPVNGLFSFDYFTYTPNRLSNLVGHNLLLDDNDSLLQYSSEWTKTNADSLQGAVVAHQNTLSGTNKTGSTMRFNFVGAAVSVYGALNQQEGRLSVSFSVDNGTATSFRPFDGTQTPNSSLWKPNERFFHQDLAPGNHTLLVTLQDMLWLDSVVYEGSSGTKLNSTTTSTGGGTTPTTTSSSSNKPFNSATIGGIIAAVVVLAVIGFCFRCWRRFARNYSKEDESSQYGNTTFVPPRAPTPQLGPVIYLVSSPHSPAPAPPPPPPMPYNPWSFEQQVYPAMPVPHPPSQPHISREEPTFWQPSSTTPRQPQIPTPVNPPASHTQDLDDNLNPAPRRSQDAGPADLPPAYEPRLYIS